MALTVLVQHSRSELREAAAAALEAAGMAVRRSCDGAEGLALLRSASVDVILTGINMRRVCGFGFIEAVRRQARLRDIPILVMAVSATPQLKARARHAGAAGWLPHPPDPARLVETVRTVAAIGGRPVA
ncbi:two-component system chemotaxis response regulator CheY [Paracoccus pantotrophus]|uniref:Response regulator n=1 Tax=Paracoccus pantotrophus TaxID=82367 RepID=A0AAE6TS19_PARPN|nr:response regulator [Paracoccus pantotrophus]QFG35023.1 response regulator [Paracoccus pantotrophus]RKS44799.1 two-component system chemotaxis response regulator CheY [Paracoccus pantotrophus]